MTCTLQTQTRRENISSRIKQFRLSAARASYFWKALVGKFLITIYPWMNSRNIHTNP